MEPMETREELEGDIDLVSEVSVMVIAIFLGLALLPFSVPYALIASFGGLTAYALWMLLLEPSHKGSHFH